MPGFTGGRKVEEVRHICITFVNSFWLQTMLRIWKPLKLSHLWNKSYVCTPFDHSTPSATVTIDCPGITVGYCCVTNYPMLSGFQQPLHRVLQFCGLEMCRARLGGSSVPCSIDIQCAHDRWMVWSHQYGALHVWFAGKPCLSQHSWPE